MNSLLASVLAAVRPGTEPHSLEEGIMPGAEAPITETPPLGAITGESTTMTTLSNAPAGASAVADVVANAATAAAPGGSHADGFKAATERLGAIMSADGIKGDGKRMAAALELAQQSPGMTAEAITAFVTANVAASVATQAAPQGGQASGYEKQRLAAANLAQPSPAGADAAKAGIDRNAIFAARRAAVKEG